MTHIHQHRRNLNHSTQRPSKSRRPLLEPMEDRTVPSITTGGALDPTFGQGGIVTTDFNGNADFANVAVVQSDGRLITGGGSRSPNFNEFTFQFALSRYNLDGSLDTTFGTGGQATGPSGDIMAMTLQGQTNPVAVGFLGMDVVLARYNANGTPDTSFGTNGVVTSHFTSLYSESATGVAIQATNAPTRVQLLVAIHGTLTITGGGEENLLARYNSDGSLDTSFGTGGVVKNLPSQVTGMLALADKSILVGTSINGQFGVLRLNYDGSLDTSFGSAGQVVVDFGASGTATAFARQNIGPQAQEILVAGSAGVAQNKEFALARLNLDGTLDTSFGINGKVMTNFGAGRDESATTIDFQADGTIVVGGTPSAAAAAINDHGFALAYYNPDGSLNTHYGSGGKFENTLGGTSEIRSVAFTPSATIRKIAVAGASNVVSSNTSNFIVAQYVPMLVNPTGSQNAIFVGHAYQNLLERPADPSGLSFWTGQLDQGKVTREMVVQGVQHSAEYQQLVVGDIYGRLLHRAVDPSGLATWTSALANGVTSRQVEISILASDEYFSRAGGVNQPNLYIQALYQGIFGRSVDPAGAQTWGQALANNVPRTNIAGALFDSAESIQNRVTGYYHSLLNRASDPGGAATFTSALAHGVPDEMIQATLMASPEYGAKA